MPRRKAQTSMNETNNTMNQNRTSMYQPISGPYAPMGMQQAVRMPVLVPSGQYGVGSSLNTQINPINPTYGPTIGGMSQPIGSGINNSNNLNNNNIHPYDQLYGPQQTNNVNGVGDNKNNLKGKPIKKENVVSGWKVSHMNFEISDTSMNLEIGLESSNYIDPNENYKSKGAIDTIKFIEKLLVESMTKKKNENNNYSDFKEGNNSIIEIDKNNDQFMALQILKMYNDHKNEITNLKNLLEQKTKENDLLKEQLSKINSENSEEQEAKKLKVFDQQEINESNDSLVEYYLISEKINEKKLSLEGVEYTE